MALSIQFNSASYRYDLDRLIERTGADAQQLLREEMRLVLAEVRKRTPPIRAGGYGKNESPRADEKAGQIAARGDMSRVAFNLDATKIRNPRLRELVLKGDEAGIQSFFDNVRDSFIGRRQFLRSESTVRTEHLKARNRYGRVKRDQRNAALAPVFHGYFLKIEHAIGKAKAIFNTAALRVGLRLPPYIARHGPQGSYAEGNRQNPYVQAGSRSYIPGMQGRINEALALRYKRLAAEVARIVDRNGKSRRASLAGTIAGQAAPTP